ncbi:MAG TPA: hypothetical protein VLA43_12635 [Longimicrobiales bacterium]|nr:hypothetical protein [Longimicrobiales bacterium]
MRTSSSFLIRGLAAALLFSAAACGDSPTKAPPGIQPQIVNNTDAFSYQVTNLNRVTGSWDYTWQNTGTLAKVTHASDAGGTGTATLTIRDGAGTQVYAGAFATTGEPMTSPVGVAGAWTVTVTYANYSNTQVNFGIAAQ